MECQYRLPDSPPPPAPPSYKYVFEVTVDFNLDERAWLYYLNSRGERGWRWVRCEDTPHGALRHLWEVPL